MLEEADRFYLKAKDVHTDLADALGLVVDYQKDLNRLGAPDKNRNRSEPLMTKYNAVEEPHPHNAWLGRHGIVR